jgi:hypothetical protein
MDGTVVILCIGVAVAYIGGLVLVWKFLEANGYSDDQISLLVLCGFVLSPLIAFFIAAAMTPAGRPRQAPVFMRRRRRLAPVGALPMPDEAGLLPDEFVQCMCCGETNNATFNACWKCGSQFVGHLPEVVAPPRLGEREPIPKGLTGELRRVRCAACGERFSGSVISIAAERKCPFCKQDPFGHQS